MYSVFNLISQLTDCIYYLVSKLQTRGVYSVPFLFLETLKKQIDPFPAYQVHCTEGVSCQHLGHTAAKVHFHIQRLALQRHYATSILGILPQNSFKTILTKVNLIKGVRCQHLGYPGARSQFHRYTLALQKQYAASISDARSRDFIRLIQFNGSK